MRDFQYPEHPTTACEKYWHWILIIGALVKKLPWSKTKRTDTLSYGVRKYKCTYQTYAYVVRNTHWSTGILNSMPKTELNRAEFLTVATYCKGNDPFILTFVPRKITSSHFFLYTPNLRAHYDLFSAALKSLCLERYGNGRWKKGARREHTWQ